MSDPTLETIDAVILQYASTLNQRELHHSNLRSARDAVATWEKSISLADNKLYSLRAQLQALLAPMDIKD